MFKGKIKSRHLTKEYICERYKLFSRKYFPARFYDENEEYEPSFAESNKDLMQEIGEMEQSLTILKIKKKTKQ